MFVRGFSYLFVDLMSRCIVVLKKILEQESKGWYIKYKDRLITELKGMKLTCFTASDCDFCWLHLLTEIATY